VLAPLRPACNIILFDLCAIRNGGEFGLASKICMYQMLVQVREGGFPAAIEDDFN
jgi:hypothetical protein